MKKIKFILIFVLIAFYWLASFTQYVGDDVIGFSFPSIDGDTINYSDYEGKVLTIFVFGNTCHYCIASAPDLEANVYQVFKNDTNFAMIGIDIWNSTSTVTSVSSFKNTTGITFKLVYQGGDFGTLYKTTQDLVFIIDKQGKISYRGWSDGETVAEHINALLGLGNITDIVQSSQFDKDINLTMFPNPVIDEATFNLEVFNACDCEILIYNTVGIKIQSIIKTDLTAGRYSLNFDASNLSKGIYFYQIKVGDKYITKKFLKK